MDESILNSSAPRHCFGTKPHWSFVPLKNSLSRGSAESQDGFRGNLLRRRLRTESFENCLRKKVAVSRQCCRGPQTLWLQTNSVYEVCRRWWLGFRKPLIGPLQALSLAKLLQPSADMKTIKSAIFLTLSLSSLEASPVVMDVPSAVENLLNQSTGASCSQSFAEVILQTDGKYAFKNRNRSGVYNLESDVGLCAGDLTKIMLKPERVTRAWIQFDDVHGFEKISVPINRIRTDRNSLYLLVHISETWLGEQPAGRRALLVFDSAPEVSIPEDFFGGSDISGVRVTVGHSITFTKIPPISTNVNNAADQSIGATDFSIPPVVSADAAAGCSLKLSEHSANGIGLIFFTLAACMYLFFTRQQKKEVIRG